MQVEGTRMYRVKDVAKHCDVSAATIYRAIESGQLDAVKLGASKGMLRVTGAAMAAYAQANTPAVTDSSAPGTGLPLFRGTVADSSAEKGREKSFPVKFRVYTSAGPAGGGSGTAVSAGGVGGHNGDTVCGGLQSGQADHLDHPCHRHDSTRRRLGRYDRGQAGVRQVPSRPERHDREGCSVTGPEPPADEGRPVADRLAMTTSITEQLGAQVAHEVTDDAFAAAKRGEFEALCGCVFVAAPLIAPSGRPCPECLNVLAAHRAAATAAVAQPRRRGGGGLLRRWWPVRKGHRATTGG
jgi:Helix-turn-helix domain